MFHIPAHKNVKAPAGQVRPNDEPLEFAQPATLRDPQGDADAVYAGEELKNEAFDLAQKMFL